MPNQILWKWNCSFSSSGADLAKVSKANTWLKLLLLESLKASFLCASLEAGKVRILQPSLADRFSNVEKKFMADILCKKTLGSKYSSIFVNDVRTTYVIFIRIRHARCFLNVINLM